MKTYISHRSPGVLDFTIDVWLIPADTSTPLVASSYKGFNIPDGNVLSGDKNATINEQDRADYDSFIESIEDLLTEYYKLDLIYKNRSKDFSRYYTFLAKDAKGNILMKFKLRLRVSNHPANRTKEQQKHRAEEEEIIRKVTKGKNVRPMSKQIIINNSIYDNYEDAFIAIDEQVDRWVKVMRRKK